ncbi:MAG: primosomal protein N', partial [Muribaculaceae bacterium]|nr:primosomal protein N' [Muribaculaceae bacterium]
MFAEIILPLPLYSTFTYEIPADMEGSLQKGSRVLVQFGKKKYYTGLVEHIHSSAPEGYETKPIMALLDADPIVRYPQLKLWHWMAEYYLCSVGEIYKAAVPTGLKPESETFISLNPDFDTPDGFKLTESQALIIQALQNKKRLKISEIESATGIKNCARAINTLMEAGILEISEKVVEKYRSKKTSVVELTIDRNDSDKLHEFFDLVARSRQQEKGLIAYLELSGWMRRGEELTEVSKEKFLSASGISPGVL